MTSKLDKAVDFYEDFHWGEKARKLAKRAISPPPKVGVKLGTLDAVVYTTRKGGERATWEHEFGEEGGKKPDLVMDVENKRLHIVGGSYDVEARGIVD